MIKTSEQALDVQILRVLKGKRGYARAVRRFLKRSTGDWHGYNSQKQNLPVNFNRNPELIESNDNGTL